MNENPAPVQENPEPMNVNPYPPQGAYPPPDPQQANPYQPYPYPQPQPVPQNALKPKRKGRPVDITAALAVAVACFIMTDCFIWTATLGLGFAVGAVLLMGTALWYLRRVIRRRSAYCIACAVTFILGCASLVFSADSGTKTLTFLCLLILYTCVLMEGMDLRAWAGGTFRSIADFCYTAFELGFLQLPEGLYALFHREKSMESKKLRGLGKALLGLLIALPLSLLLIVLLGSADAAFDGMIKQIDLGSLPERLLSVLLAAFAFIFLFSQLFSLNDAQRPKRQESGKGLDPLVVTFFLIGVGLVYVAYLFSQLSYFFSGFMDFLPQGFTYAEYARRGFFELSAVSVINIAIVIIVSAFIRKKDEKLPTAVRLSSLFLCLFSLVLTATEIAKMKMYMDSFGLTRLRILTTVFMIFLAVVFLALIIHLFRLRFPYLKVAVITGILMMIVLNFAGVDRMVAEYNVWAYQSGVLKTVDVDTITELGDAAVPALLKIAHDDDFTVGMKARNSLYDRYKSMYQYPVTRRGGVKSYDLRGFNLVTYETRKLLLDNKELFVQYK